MSVIFTSFSCLFRMFNRKSQEVQESGKKEDWKTTSKLHQATNLTYLDTAEP